MLCLQAAVGGVLGCAASQAPVFGDVHGGIAEHLGPFCAEDRASQRPLFELSEVALSCVLEECESPGGSCLFLGF